MIKNIIGAAVGANIAKNTKVDNGTGAILGSLAPALIARMSLPAMVAIGVGGYMFKRHRDKQNGVSTTGHTAAKLNDSTSATSGRSTY
jgi:hypothetical protein